MIPDGKIFLIGGEEPEYFIRRENHVFNPLLNDRKLLQKSILIKIYIQIKEIFKLIFSNNKWIFLDSMPHKKYDFSICYLKNSIYIICGKDSVSEVTDSCEKYLIEED